MSTAEEPSSVKGETALTTTTTTTTLQSVLADATNDPPKDNTAAGDAGVDDEVVLTGEVIKVPDDDPDQPGDAPGSPRKESQRSRRLRALLRPTSITWDAKTEIAFLKAIKDYKPLGLHARMNLALVLDKFHRLTSGKATGPDIWEKLVSLYNMEKLQEDEMADLPACFSEVTGFKLDFAEAEDEGDSQAVVLLGEAEKKKKTSTPTSNKKVKLAITGRDRSPGDRTPRRESKETTGGAADSGDEALDASKDEESEEEDSSEEEEATPGRKGSTASATPSIVVTPASGNRITPKSRSRRQSTASDKDAPPPSTRKSRGGSHETSTRVGRGRHEKSSHQESSLTPGVCDEGDSASETIEAVASGNAKSLDGHHLQPRATYSRRDRERDASTEKEPSTPTHHLSTPSGRGRGGWRGGRGGAGLKAAMQARLAAATAAASDAADSSGDLSTPNGGSGSGGTPEGAIKKKLRGSRGHSASSFTPPPAKRGRGGGVSGSSAGGGAHGLKREDDGESSGGLVTSGKKRKNWAKGNL